MIAWVIALGIVAVLILILILRLDRIQLHFRKK